MSQIGWIFEFCDGHYTRHTFWSCLIRCANMKWIRWVLLKIQSGHDSVQTDGQGDTSLPPFQLRWSAVGMGGGYNEIVVDNEPYNITQMTMWISFPKISCDTMIRRFELRVSCHNNFSYYYLYLPFRCSVFSILVCHWYVYDQRFKVIYFIMGPPWDPQTMLLMGPRRVVMGPIIDVFYQRPVLALGYCRWLCLSVCAVTTCLSAR